MQYNGSTIGTPLRRYLHADHQGSIVAHSDSWGANQLKLSYDSFGIPKGPNMDRFQYTGQAYLREIGLFYYKARMYSPKLGRFLQTDPIYYADDMNTYAYVGNDPANRFDPQGTQDVQSAASCGEKPELCFDPVKVELEPPLGEDDYIDNDGNIVSPPKGYKREDESSEAQGPSRSPKAVDLTKPPSDADVPPSAPKTNEPDGTGPAGYDAARKDWENANAERWKAQREGDLIAAAQWSQRAREAQIKMMATQGIKVDPKAYGLPTGHDR